MPTLGTKYQVYALDSVGGFGDTDPYYPASEGVQSRVDQLEAFMDTLCIEKAAVGGNSQGAWVAAKYALDHPDRVEKLVLIASNTISGSMGMEIPMTEGMKAIRAYNGTEESMRAFLQTIVWNKNLITDELVKLRNDCANRPGAEQARKVFQEGSAKANQRSQPAVEIRHAQHSAETHYPDNLHLGRERRVCAGGARQATGKDAAERQVSLRRQGRPPGTERSP
jgi:pimeloyl-ACP methyl ester carboxylesterase